MTAVRLSIGYSRPLHAGQIFRWSARDFALAIALAPAPALDVDVASDTASLTVAAGAIGLEATCSFGIVNSSGGGTTRVLAAVVA